MAQKTGADAVSRAISHACRVFNAYRSKLLALVDAAETAHAITSDQAIIMRDFLGTLSTLCVAFEALADFNSITP